MHIKCNPDAIFISHPPLSNTITPYYTTVPLQLTLGPNNLPNHKMLMPTNLLTRNDHDQIPQITNLKLIVGHKLFRIPHPFPVLWHDAISIHRHIDRFLHLVRHDGADEGTPRSVATGRIAYEMVARDGGYVGQLGVGHLRNGGGGASVLVGVG